MDGFWFVDENAFGPVHEYVAPATFEAVRLSVEPAQIGELLPAVGAAGVAFTTTFTVPCALVHPFTVTVSISSKFMAVNSNMTPVTWGENAKLYDPTWLPAPIQ